MSTNGSLTLAYAQHSSLEMRTTAILEDFYRVESKEKEKELAKVENMIFL